VGVDDSFKIFNVDCRVRFRLATDHVFLTNLLVSSTHDRMGYTLPKCQTVSEGAQNISSTRVERLKRYPAPFPGRNPILVAGRHLA